MLRPVLRRTPTAADHTRELLLIVGVDPAVAVSGVNDGESSDVYSSWAAYLDRSVRRMRVGRRMLQHFAAPLYVPVCLAGHHPPRITWLRS